MIDRAEAVKTIINYLEGVLTDAGNGNITESKDLREFAGFDSLGILETLVWLETTFSVTIPDEELVVDRFDSVGKMADFVVAKGR